MKKTALTIGKFDGLHLGHRLLLESISKEAEKRDLDAILIKIKMPGQSLFTEEEKSEFIGREFPQIKEIRTMTFIPEFAKISAEDFVKKVLVEEYGVSYLAVGRDFKFGRDRLGDTELLKRLGSDYGFEVNVFDKLEVGGGVVSSTVIKDKLSAGDISGAAELLGHPYLISGVVGDGKKLGRTLGYPTVNLKPEEAKYLPRYGVYSSDIIIDGRTFSGITNIGVRPSVDDGESPNAETFIYNFSDDIYGERVEVVPKRFIRPEIKFDSLSDLTKQIELDILEAGGSSKFRD